MQLIVIMKKTDLIISLSNKSELTKANAKASVEVILEALTQGVVSGKGVEIRGFGGFYKKHRKARLGINPKTSERTKVGEKFVPFFKPGKLLRATVDK